MKIVADECVDEEDVLILADHDNTLLLTADKDFGELVFRQGLVKRGILLYRLAKLTKLERVGIISAAIASHGNELLLSFSVLTEKAIRIRKAQ